MRPWAFKVRGGGNATGIKGGPVKAGIQGGVGALYSQDAVFTIATHQDQWIATPPLTDNQYQYSHQMNHPIGKPLRYVSVCSGMEAASVAWHPLGWTPVGFSEIEPFPCAILKHRFPNVPNYGSLTEYQSWPIEPGTIDLLVGGTPCQSFSVAGLRKGLADPRGNLALVFLGLADKLKPKWIVWENVPGVLSSNGGRDFGSFVGALGQLGYGWAMRILDAQHFGVPQRRRRVFVVACLGDWRAPAEVLSLREGLRGYLEAGGKKRKGVAADAGSGVEAGIQRTVGTLCADTHPGAYSGQDAYTGRLIPDQKPVNETIGTPCARDYKGVGNQYVQEGKCIPCPAPIPIQDGREMEKNQNGMGVGNPGDPAYTIDTTGAQAAGIPFRKSKRACSTTDNETWVPADVTNTLNNFDLGDTRTTHAVVSSVAPTVTSSGPPYSRTGNERVEAEALAITFQPGNLRREAGAEPSTTTTTTTLKASAGDQTPHVATFKPGNSAQAYGIGYSETTSPTLEAGGGGNNRPAVIHTQSQGVDLYNQTLTGDLHVPLRTAGGHGAPATLQAMAVRRLTPVECERLQGFPDNWSRIPWKGKPETECPDGPRYKACGNSMAVPCMFWIGQRIANYELNNPSQNHEAK